MHLLKLFRKKNPLLVILTFSLSALFSFSIFTVFSSSHCDHPDNYRTCLENGQNYGLNIHSKDALFLSDDASWNGLKKEFGANLSYSGFYGEEDHRNVFLDPALPEGSGEMDHETYLALGCPKTLPFRGDFYTLEYKITNDDATRIGLYVSTAYGKAIQEVRLRNFFAENPDPFESPSTTLWPLSWAKQKGVIGKDITLPAGTLLQEASEPPKTDFLYRPLSLKKEEEPLRDKVLDLAALFPSGFHVVALPYLDTLFSNKVILNDEDFQKILLESHPYASFAITLQEEGKAPLIRHFLDSTHVSIYDPSGRLEEKSDQILAFSNKDFNIHRFAFLSLGLWFFVYALLSLEVLEREKDDFTRLRFYGFSPLRIGFSYLAETALFALLGEIISLFFLPWAFSFINTKAIEELGFQIAFWDEACTRLAVLEGSLFLALPIFFLIYSFSTKNTLRAMKGLSS